MLKPRSRWPVVAFALIGCRGGVGGAGDEAADDESSETDATTEESGGADTVSLGGRVEGLKGGGLTLANDGEELSITSNGSFRFDGLLSPGDTYEVVVAAEPTLPGQTCTVESGMGVAASQDIQEVGVRCAGAWPPGLDPDFGEDGVLVLDDFLSSGGTEFPFAIALAPQSKILVAGQAQGEEPHAVVWRILDDGSPDLGFGGDGFVDVDTGWLDFYADVAADDDGNVLAVGRSGPPPAGGRLMVYRYLEDGTPDPGFGTGGFVEFNKIGGCVSDGSEEAAYAMALDGGGHAVVAGRTSEMDCSETDLVVVRIDAATGALDDGFADGGMFVHQPGGAATQVDEGLDLGIGEDGRIWIAGRSWPGGGELQDPTLWRLLPDGSLDPALDGVGFRVYGDLDPAGSDHAASLVLDTLGGAVLVGQHRTDDDPAHMVAWRVDPDGAVDDAFGATGVVDRPALTGSSGALSVATDVAGNLIVVGVRDNFGKESDVAVWRLLPNGEADESFHDEGLWVYDHGHGRDVGYDLAVDAQGRIFVAASVTTEEGDVGIGVLRLLP